MPCGFTMARKSKKTERVPTELEPELASLRENVSVPSSNESPEALTGSAHHGDESSLPPRSAHQRVEPDTEKSETVPRSKGNPTGRKSTKTGVTRKGLEPIGSSPIRLGTGLERTSLPIRLATTRVEPNTVDSEIGPRTQMGSTLSVPNSNDASHNYVIPPPSSRHSETKSKATPVPFDPLSPASTGSRRTRKKKSKTPQVSLLIPPPRTGEEGTLPSPNVRPRADPPQKKPPVTGQHSEDLKQKIADFNRTLREKGLEEDISALSEFETSSPDIVSPSTLPLPTVMNQAATDTNDATKTDDPVISRRPTGRFGTGNRWKSIKEKAELRAMKIGRFVAKTLSPTHQTIRLPTGPSEIMDTLPTTNSIEVTTPRVDPPDSDSTVDDASKLWHDWEKKTSEELSSESPSPPHSPGNENDSQPSPENRNDIISDVLSGPVRSVTEPEAIVGRLIQSKHIPQSPPAFSDASEISPVSSDESFKPPDPTGNNIVPIHHDHPSSGVFPNAYITSTVPRGIRSPVNEDVVQYDESSSLLTLTADPADVSSLVRNSVTGSEDYADYYWVGDLPPLVVQSLSPCSPQVLVSYSRVTSIAYMIQSLMALPSSSVRLELVF